MGAAGYCWVLEDFHKVAEEHKESLAQMMKVFMDVSDKYENLKIVAIGAVNTAREIVRYDREMRRRVSEIHVELMSDAEIEEIIAKGEINLNVKFSERVKSDIVHYSNGLAAICHRLCYILCDIEQIYETLDDAPYEIDDISPAVEEYLKEESDTIKCSLDKALKAKGAEDVLRVISSNGREGMTIEIIHDKLLELSVKIKTDKLLAVLNDLVLEKYGEIIKLDLDSGRYAFSDPFLHSFSRVFFEEKDNRESSSRLSEREMISLLNTAMRAMIARSKSLGVDSHSGDADSQSEDDLRTNTEADSR
ncbi:hypothetical protein [Iodobacter ciconiae]|uniref:Uncharacterized protein n=1 Tax=Iodobacter ciconiae TaxID=2496266 RepID=A0A3S8ZNY2_9NEIS|nr:hypothetical protein [Iodobacter ciconiae]AZN35160.1 hypothetical protein EJO50_00860 [Iodobacter ciconiae]